MAAMVADLAAAYRSALTQALAWAALVATAVAAVVAWTVTRRLLAPLADAARARAARSPRELRRAPRRRRSRRARRPRRQLQHDGRGPRAGRGDPPQLLSDLSHELRTPLSNLRGYLEALEDGVFTLDAPTSGGAAAPGRADRAPGRGPEPAHRLEAGQVAVDRGRSTSRPGCRQPAAFRARFEERGIALSPWRRKPGDRARRRVADRAGAREPAGERAPAHAARRPRVVATRASGAALRVEVRDTGPGVPRPSSARRCSAGCFAAIPRAAPGTARAAASGSPSPRRS
jgi:two-component system, OmpR family, sensor histidine kinase BaeS